MILGGAIGTQPSSQSLRPLSSSKFRRRLVGRARSLNVPDHRIHVTVGGWVDIRGGVPQLCLDRPARQRVSVRRPHHPQSRAGLRAGVAVLGVDPRPAVADPPPRPATPTSTRLARAARTGRNMGIPITGGTRHSPNRHRYIDRREGAQATSSRRMAGTSLTKRSTTSGPLGAGLTVF